MYMYSKITLQYSFLVRQGLPLHRDESESNYVQLLKLQGEDDSRAQDWLQRKTDKYTCKSPEMQNERIQFMAFKVLRELVSFLHATPFYTVMMDETTDASNCEQVVVCLCWVSEDFEVNEELMGLYSVDSIKAEILFSAIKDILLRFNLALSDIRGQCDGTAPMAGYKIGVTTRLLQEQPKALYSHCYGHALNLAYGDMTKQIKVHVLKDALDTAFEMVRFIKYSSQREACFGYIKVGTRHTRRKSIMSYSLDSES